MRRFQFPFFTILTILALVSYRVSAEPKDYQSILMSEPMSLLDFIVIRADMDVDEFVDGKIDGYKLSHSELRSIDWEYEPKPNQHASSFSSGHGYAEFDYSKGEFNIVVSKPYSLPNWWNVEKDMVEFNKENGLMKISQKNFASLCEIYLRKLRFGVRLKPMTHQGYQNSKTDSLSTPKLYGLVKKDTTYKFTIELDGIDTSLSCSIGATEDIKDQVKFSFAGNWHELDDVMKERMKKQ